MTSSPPRPLAARLHYLGLGSPDPSALAAFYEKNMGLRLTALEEGVLGRCAGRRLYFVHGGARTLAFAGFALETHDDLAALRARVMRSGAPHETAPAGHALLLDGALTVRDPDGNRLSFGLARPDEALAPAPLPARLQHFVVASRDAARLSRFYQEALGFTLSDNVVDEDGGLRTAFLRCSEEHHSFAVFQAASDRFDHHCYEAGDWALIRDWGDHFAARDIPIAWGPGRHGPGNNLFLFIHDPDGNWLEISAELETVAPDRPAGVWPHAQKTLNSWGSAPLRS